MLTVFTVWGSSQCHIKINVYLSVIWEMIFRINMSPQLWGEWKAAAQLRPIKARLLSPIHCITITQMDTHILFLCSAVMLLQVFITKHTLSVQRRQPAVLCLLTAASIDGWSKLKAAGSLIADWSAVKHTWLYTQVHRHDPRWGPRKQKQPGCGWTQRCTTHRENLR